MPFNREWRQANGDEAGLFVNRDRTGPPVPPQPGVLQTEDGIVVGADTTLVGPATTVLQPDKAIPVTIPGPREPVLDATGIMAPRWRRFFEELYRRTGALEDNINAAVFGVDASSDFTGTIAITGNAVTITHSHVAIPSTASVAITEQAVKLHGVMAPDTGTITITEQQADRTVA
jgi:hypothetical protein